MTANLARSVIAVGVDDSEASRKALEWAAREALLRGSTLELVTTWGMEHSTIGPKHSGPGEAENLEKEAHAVQQAQVDAVLAGMDPKPAHEGIIVHKNAADALIDASAEADLIVVGTHGRGMVRTFLFGSVSQALVKSAQCPVVIIPGPVIDGD